jgi:hypothetical protein
MIDTSPFQLNPNMWGKTPENNDFAHIWGALNSISREVLWQKCQSNFPGF